MYAEIRRVESSEEPFVSVCYDPILDSLVTCTYSKNTNERTGHLRVLNKWTLEDEWSSELTSAAFHLERGADFYVAGLGDGQVVFFDPRTRLVEVDQPRPSTVQMVTDAKLTTCGRVGITDESGALRVYERSTSIVTFDVARAHELCGRAVNAWTCDFLDSNTVVSGGDDDQLKLWDTRATDRRPMNICRCHGGGVVRTRKVEHDGGTQLCTGSYDQHLRFFDLRRLDEPTDQIRLNGGVWDFEVQDTRVLVANMYGGWSIVERSPALRLLDHQPMLDSLVYGVTSSPMDPDVVFCCSFTDGVLCAMSQNAKKEL